LPHYRDAAVLWAVLLLSIAALPVPVSSAQASISFKSYPSRITVGQDFDFVVHVTWQFPQSGNTLVVAADGILLVGGLLYIVTATSKECGPEIHDHTIRAITPPGECNLVVGQSGEADISYHAHLDPTIPSFWGYPDCYPNTIACDVQHYFLNHLDEYPDSINLRADVGCEACGNGNSISIVIPTAAITTTTVYMPSTTTQTLTTTYRTTSTTQVGLSPQISGTAVVAAFVIVCVVAILLLRGRKKRR
jgi:hypothetical protein